MAIVDLVKYEGPDDVFAWKYPSNELSNWTQLIVNESQEAVLFRGGQAMDLFTSGRHTLGTENVPLLSKIISLPFGGRSPFTAEVWFVNKKYSMDIKWGTRHPIQLLDPKYNIMVPVRSFGQFGIRISDSRKFLIKLTGTSSELDERTLTDYFRGLLMTGIKDHISGYLVHKKVSMFDINAYLSDISAHITGKIQPMFQDFGIEILHFYVNSINMPDDDEGVKRLKNALATKAEMDIVGFDYRQKRSFDTLESAASNEGAGQSGTMGAGIGLGMGVGVGGVFGQAMTGISEVMQPTKKCPGCGSSNPDQARFCFSCGHGFVQQPAPEQKPTPASLTSCSKCAEPIQPGFKFCPKCGASVTCTKCGEVLQAGMKFCPSCGNPQ